MFLLTSRPEMKTYSDQWFQYLQPKLDGHRLTIIKNTHGLVRAYGRTEDLWMKVGANEDINRRVISLPPGSVIDGELYLEDEEATSVPNAMSQRPEDLKFRAFAAPWYAGNDLRKEPLESVFHNADAFEWIDTVCLTDRERLAFKQDPESSVKGLIAKARSLGLEGYVLKASHYAGWYKLKVNQTIDAVVMEWNEGRGRLAGKMGSLTVGMYRGGELVKIGTVSGFSDEERALYGREVIGRVLEATYDSFTTHGQLKFARFYRWRADKKPYECV